MSIRLMLGRRELKITAGATGMLLTYKEAQGTETREPVSTMGVVDLVAYLVRATPVFSTQTYNALMEDVEEYKTRAIRNKKLKERMAKISAQHFSRGLSSLTNGELSLVQRAAEAEIAVEEAEGNV